MKTICLTICIIFLTAGCTLEDLKGYYEEPSVRICSADEVMRVYVESKARPERLVYSLNVEQCGKSQRVLASGEKIYLPVLSKSSTVVVYITDNAGGHSRDLFIQELSSGMREIIATDLPVPSSIEFLYDETFISVVDQNGLAKLYKLPLLDRWGQWRR